MPSSKHSWEDKSESLYGKKWSEYGLRDTLTSPRVPVSIDVCYNKGGPLMQHSTPWLSSEFEFVYVIGLHSTWEQIEISWYTGNLNFFGVLASKGRS